MERVLRKQGSFCCFSMFLFRVKIFIIKIWVAKSAVRRYTEDTKGEEGELYD